MASVPAVEAVGFRCGWKQNAFAFELTTVRVADMGVPQQPDIHPGGLQFRAGHREVIATEIRRQTFETSVGDAYAADVVL